MEDRKVEKERSKQKVGVILRNGEHAYLVLDEAEGNGGTGEILKEDSLLQSHV